MSEGDNWKKKKKILSNVFNFDFIHSKIGLIAKVSEEKIKDLEERSRKEGENTFAVDITAYLQRVFGTVVIKSFFGDTKLDSLGG